VYEAKYVDGTIKRMSFWSPAGKPLDVAAGRRLMTGLHDKPIFQGFVYHESVGVICDDRRDQTTSKIKRVTVKQTREALSCLLAYLDGEHDNADCIAAARKLAA
jgi:hypothetical protein